MQGPYQLIASQIAHDGPIRCLSFGPNEGEVLTGCQSDAPCLKRWRLSSLADSFEEVGSPIFHDHWVTAITSLSPDSNRAAIPQGCIITGCLDSKIRVFDPEGSMLFTLQGHSKGVISFSWTSAGLLVSGGWDGIAILWDLATSREVMRLGPHENGVNVLGLPNGLVATTSTGESVDGKPANFKLRLWDPSTGQLARQPIEDHGGSIRSIAFLPGVSGILTTSNDGTVMLRGCDGEAIEALMHPLQEDGSHPMVLNCTALSAASGMDAVSCGEDGSLCVWQGADLLQSIPHPSTIWAVLAMPSDPTGCAFLTGGHDGMLRLFSKDPLFTANARVQQLSADFANEVASAQQAKKRGPSAEDLAKAPRWEQRGSHPGRKEDDIMVFNQDGRMIAAQWTSGSWVVVGEVTNTGDGGYIGSDWYDHVFPVEIETPTGLRSLKLGYNNAENPFSAAQRFINANELDQYHLSQIVDWIVQRSQQASAPTLGATAPSGGQQPTAHKQGPKGFTQAISGYAVFDEVPGSAEKVLTKIREVHVNHVVHLSADQFAVLEQTLRTLSDSSHHHSSTLSPSIFGALSIMMQWPLENRFIAYDILRLIAVHPQGSELLAASAFCRTLLQNAINLLQQGGAPHSSIMMICRFTANMLKSETLKRVVVTNFLNEARDLIHACLAHVTHNNKLVRLAAITVAFNLVAALKLSGNSFRIVATVDIMQAMVTRSVQLIQTETDGSPAAFRAVQVLGTLFATDGAQFGGFAGDVRTAITAAMHSWTTKGPEVTAALQEVLNLL